MIWHIFIEKAPTTLIKKWRTAAEPLRYLRFEDKAAVRPSLEAGAG
jgi:hypothetical protein